MNEIVIYSLATASITLTLSKSMMPLVKAFRDGIKKRNNWEYRLIKCPYCFSHWIAFMVCFPKLFSGGLVDYILYSFATIALSAPMMAAIYKSISLIGGEENEQQN